MLQRLTMCQCVDYYVKNAEGEYVVVKEVLRKINGEPVNKVLWQESK